MVLSLLPGRLVGMVVDWSGHLVWPVDNLWGAYFANTTFHLSPLRRQRCPLTMRSMGALSGQACPPLPL